jgi:hypothetical protein
MRRKKMTLESYLVVVGQLTTGMIWTAFCILLVALTCVYGYKTGMRLIRNADNNLEKFKNVKIFKTERTKHGKAMRG